MKPLNYKIEIMTAALNGKPMQYSCVDPWTSSPKWNDLNCDYENIIWNWADINFRVKPSIATTHYRLYVFMDVDYQIVKSCNVYNIQHGQPLDATSKTLVERIENDPKFVKWLTPWKTHDYEV